MVTNWTYCPERLGTTPGHACLCHNHTRHDGPHECVCGHTWADWNTMTYDQQRAWLGLPEVPKPYAVNPRLVGQRIAYVDQDGRTHDAGIVTEYRSVNDVVTITTQTHPEGQLAYMREEVERIAAMKRRGQQRGIWG